MPAVREILMDIMKQPITLLIAFVILSAFTSLPLHAQSTPADSLYRLGQSLYDDGDFDGAELAALRGLRLATDLDELGKLKFHLLLGFVYVARDQKANALQEFNQVLMANPAYDLDPVTTSPKIMEVFRQARNEYLLRVASEPAVYRMPQSDVRLAASWRSLIAPGWGQFYKKQEVKGSAFAAAEIVSLAVLIFMQTETNRRHNDYLDKRMYGDPNIENAYNEYRRAYQVRNVVGYVTLGIYMLNYLDALYYPVFKKHK
jgi:tetratricopeptide (TPR) repeat protein